jgi:tRNA pseudouridine55 synthase
MDGLLVLDKPVGPTSHDVVVRLRRLLRERRIGHTGTLDPGASGVLPMVVGCATRLATFLSAATKAYEATLHLGFATTSGDAAGDLVGARYEGAFPTREQVTLALAGFRGTYLQRPPALSAKKIGGRRSYDLARRDPDAATRPEPVSVTVFALEILEFEPHRLTLAIECTAGFYVRSLAHDLGAVLGTGAHLVALRRTRSGDLTLADALPLAAVELDPARAAAALIPPARMLPAWTAVTLTPEGAAHARHGRDLQAADIAEGAIDGLDTCHERHVRLLTPDGRLLGVAERSAPGRLHPSVVLV